MKRLTALAVAILLTSGCASAANSAGRDGEHEAPESSASSAAESSYTPIDPMSFQGSGDDVLDIGDFSDSAVLTFTCNGCSSNTTLKTDGREGLLVNTIGSYAGSHFINLMNGSMTTRVIIGATGSWRVTIEDVVAASSAKSGSGDAALLYLDDATKARITNRGESNFVVKSYPLSGNRGGLLVNEIGSYQGTVPLEAPAFVQVISSGSWTIDLS